MVLGSARPGVLTDLDGVAPEMLARLGASPLAICAPVHALVIQPTDAFARTLPPERLEENQLRPAARLVDRMRALAPVPLHVERDPASRVVGTCRHFAVGSDYDELLDQVAAATTGDDSVAIAELFEHEDLRVPERLTR